MSFFDTFTQMSVLFIMVIIGFCANKTGFMDEEFGRRLSSLIIHVTSPFIILSSAMGDTLPAPQDIAPVLIAGTACLLFMAVISFPLGLVFRVKDAELNQYRFMLIFGNVSFIGFPVVGSLFGLNAIFYASLVMVPFNLLVFTLGLFLIVKGTGSMKVRLKTLISPAMLATYITVVLVYFQIRTPHPIAQACTLVGSITIPGSLLIIGSSLADIPLRDMLGSVRIFLMSALKLVAIPLVIYVILLFMPLEKKYSDVLVILCGMPVAAYGTMFCLKNGIDARLMAQGTFWSTFCALFSIPLLSVIL